MNEQVAARRLGKDFVKDLHLLAGFAFPLTCPHCGKTYDDVEQFLERTQATDNLNGVMEACGFDTVRILEVLRRCECGKLLLEEFEDRRDRSDEGIEHRAVFGRLVKELRLSGMTRDEARSLLLSLVSGLDSEQLGMLQVH
ncbi:MAG: hypothetical protein QGI24_06455 [Kiritimatiellia bacterium]|jgi:hypothetical protein|nr:hypothetical protein [Kiritimatiellia bacterium]MDP6848412.1 hypothetical protein [Kiritimatiellia bacterium]